MTSRDILDLIAGAVRDASSSTPDFARLRAVAALALAALRVLEQADLEARMTELEERVARLPQSPKGRAP